MNAGKKTIDWLFTEQLKVDAEWSVRSPTGFTWWAHRHAQQVEVTRELEGPDGEKGYVVRIRTEFLKGPNLQAAGPMLEMLMTTPSMSGLVYDPAKNMLYLSAAVLVHEGIWQWMARMLSVAAMLQISDAHVMANKVAAAVGGTPATSGHPNSGPRAEPDELAAEFPSMCYAEGRQPSRWREAEFDAALRQFMQRPPAVLASGGGAGVTIEFPYGQRTSLCRMNGNEDHPLLGNGLLILQSFPEAHLRKSDDALRELALQQNRDELSEDPKGYGFGSYGYRDGCIHFSTFLPNLTYVQGLLPNLFFQCASRAAHMATVLLNGASSGSSPGQGPPPQSAMERFLGFFKRR